MGPTATPADGVVAIGASAGGIEALSDLAASMPAGFPFAVMVVTHMGRNAPSVLARIIDRSGTLPATTAVDGAVLERGRIYAAVPDHHLLARGHRVVLSDGPWESGHRPSIDVLFRSVALDYGPRAIGVLMSGMLDDGVAGLQAIKSKGGVTVVQEPTDALFPDLPRNALRAGVADHAVAAREIGGLLGQLVERGVEAPEADPDGRLELENRIAMGSQFAASVGADELGRPTGYTCPNCHSPLIAVSDNSYRCQVGHGWTAEALLSALDDEVEDAVWMVIRILKEKARLSLQLAERPGAAGDSERYTASARQARQTIVALGEGLTGRGRRAPGRS
ncbi:chemotaxis protein CheB [Mycobacterium saskatchewanense]|uniref:protein-glutamate methylesterase n=1 Tax=Mycobacterium saskatchewanense TaxID=220927 RepID=A0AAJ3NTQ6_9MYCO|nr:chemotaxis protein CheB [Mycobacterium saskatchewanense]ORW73529.1 protein-glutamate methylesterase [Mycobacterium saskatchewanense]BBX63126.1 chemotaxis protein CheB [Mycobacterium saskatchewanense]